ncbi:MAG: hypothetical protein FWD83_09145 [Promicromonosporaceae bacterium]|nr:hypothetical protein [Promicromonosporaceae bacterium]
MTLTDTNRAITSAVDALPYAPPHLEVIACPAAVTSLAGFQVSGRASGTEIEGCQVRVTVAGVERHGWVHDGRWQVRFELGALARKALGACPVEASITDRWYNKAEAIEVVVVEEFVDGFVQIDNSHQLLAGNLLATGELGLGTHETGRELVVVLVNADGVAVTTGVVARGWQYGEWRASLAVDDVAPGTYRLRAILTDIACGSLTRQTVGPPFQLG